jgi:hypothetical protein
LSRAVEACNLPIPEREGDYHAEEHHDHSVPSPGNEELPRSSGSGEFSEGRSRCWGLSKELIIILYVLRLGLNHCST